MIMNYPQLAKRINDNEIEDMVNSLGIDSIKHYGVVAAALARLGGTPTISLESLPEDKDLNQIFRMQLDKEILAFGVHHRCADLVQDHSLKIQFNTIANEEKSHIKTVEAILDKFNQIADKQAVIAPVSTK